MTKKLKVLFTQGLPASGKSTWAREFVESQGGNWVRINLDSIRDMLHADQKWNKSLEEVTQGAKQQLVLQALRAGKNVVVDDTNFGEAIPRLKEFLGTCVVDGTLDDTPEYEVKEFHIYLHEALARNNARQGKAKVPTWVIKQMHRRHIMGGDQKERPHYRPFDPIKLSCILVDVDGTTALQHEGRTPYEHEKSGDDYPHVPIITLANDMRTRGVAVADRGIIIPEMMVFSAREEVRYDTTADWLRRNGLLFDNIYMRREGDRREDSIVKQEMYQQFIEPRYNVLFVLDDRVRVCEMWRSIGLPTLQVNYGDF